MNRRTFIMAAGASVAGAAVGIVQPRVMSVFSEEPRPGLAFRVDDPGRAMLGFLLSRPGREEALAKYFSLGEAKTAALRSLWHQEPLEPRRFMAERDGDRSSAAAVAFNERVAQFRHESHDSFRSLLTESEYAEAVPMLEAWWLEDFRKKANLDREGLIHTAHATHSSCNGMFATQYSPNTPGSVEISVPDKYIKFITRGWYGLLPPFGYPVWLDTRATITWFSTSRTAAVNEVGPWNEDDNWWDSSPASDGCRGRRMYASVARCTSEAWLAFYYGYNGGPDQFGRTVLNPGEVDLSYAFASSLGLAYLQNDFVSVVPLWHGC